MMSKPFTRDEDISQRKKLGHYWGLSSYLGGIIRGRKNLPDISKTPLHRLNTLLSWDAKVQMKTIPLL